MTKIVTSVKNVGKQSVYDISVQDVEQYVLANGVVTHNTGVTYSANQIYIIGRSQEKTSEGVTGWNFTMKAEKSRFVKEKSQFTFQVMYDGGMNEFSGLLELALESGHVVKTGHYYQAVDVETGEIVGKKLREKDTNTREFWSPIVTNDAFNEYVKTKFMLTSKRTYEEVDNEEEDDDQS